MSTATIETPCETVKPIQPLSLSKLNYDTGTLEDAEIMLATPDYRPKLSGNPTGLKHVTLSWDQRTERCSRCLGDGDQVEINSLNEDRLVTCPLCEGLGTLTIPIMVLTPVEG